MTSSPTYPKSNGLVEKTVQIAKDILKKAKLDGKDPHLAILEQRNTPVDNFKSPAQLSMGRRLRSLLPSTTKHLTPESTSHQEVMSRFIKKQNQQKLKSYHDRQATPLQTLKVGEPVRIQREGKWKPATVVAEADTPRSYIVKTPDGATYRRNRIHLNKDKSSQQSERIVEQQAESITPAKAGDEASKTAPVSQPEQDNEMTTRTRSGRSVKKPVKFALDE